MIEFQRLQGLIYGCAVGDAFGMATEMLSQAEIKAKVGMISMPIASLPESLISKNRPAGSVTDDTLNTLMILDMLNETKGQIEVGKYIAKLRAWSIASPIAGFVTGPSTSRALAQIDSGVPLDEAGKMGTTNGAAMKIAPLGIVLDYHDLKGLVAAVAAICLPTHNTTIAISGASVIAAVANYSLRGQHDWNEIWELADKAAEVAQAHGHNWPCAALRFRLAAARKIVDEEGDTLRCLARLYDEIGSGMETIETVPTALALSYLSQGNPQKCAQLSAIIGGDTDTIGAISVALCGALNPDLLETDMAAIGEVNQIDFPAILATTRRQLAAYISE